MGIILVNYATIKGTPLNRLGEVIVCYNRQ